MTTTPLSPESTDDLVARRDAAAAAYYNGTATMTDDAFDALTTELARRGIAEQVGHGVAGGKVIHERAMLSLRKVHDVADLEALIAANPGPYTVEPKFDGIAASVRYDRDGRLSVAAKRGSGDRGDDITAAVRAIFARCGLPDQLDGKAEVRGEIVLLRSDFARLNAEKVNGGEAAFSNARNAASGMIGKVVSAAERAERTGTDADRERLADAAATAGRWLTFLAYDAEGVGMTLTSATELLTSDCRVAGYCDNAPFARFALPEEAFGDHPAGVASAVAWLAEHLDDLDVGTDGVVVKLTDPAARESLGESATAPRWALAYKYPNRPKETALRAVEWAETRTGRVVPTGVFDAVEFPTGDGEGVTVTRATLNNVAFLEELDLMLADTIEVARANEVIPNVVGRVGEHPTAAAPVTGPDGFPLAAGTLVNQVFAEPEGEGDYCLYTTVQTPDGEALFATFDGDDLTVASKVSVADQPWVPMADLPGDRRVIAALEAWLEARFTGQATLAADPHQPVPDIRGLLGSGEFSGFAFHRKRASGELVLTATFGGGVMLICRPEIDGAAPTLWRQGEFGQYEGPLALSPADAAAVERWCGERHQELRARGHLGMIDLPGVRYTREGRDFRHQNTDSLATRAQAVSFGAERLDILGLGVSTAERLLAEHSEITNFAGLVNAAHEGTLRPFERATDKLVAKLTVEIVEKTSGPQDPAKWIAAVGVPGVGRSAGKKLVAAIVKQLAADYAAVQDDPTLSAPGRRVSPFAVLWNADRDWLLSVDGFGESMVDAIYGNPVWNTWDAVFAGWFEWAWPAASAQADPEVDDDAAPLPLAGKRVLVTGALPWLSRKDAEVRIEQLGGTVASSVSKNLDLLVAGERAGSKLTKAEALGIEIMDGATFEAL